MLDVQPDASSDTAGQTLTPQEKESSSSKVQKQGDHPSAKMVGDSFEHDTSGNQRARFDQSTVKVDVPDSERADEIGKDDVPPQAISSQDNQTPKEPSEKS